MPAIKKFNIRIYGIHVNQQKELLVTDEYRLNMYITKFPGGGLELGEGAIDCLKRECLEEFGQKIFNIKHFYTTDYFQPTTLFGEYVHQLISIYYTFDIRLPYSFATTDKIFDFDKIENSQTFRWAPVKDLKEDMFTLPIDKKVAAMIMKKYL